MAPTIEAVRSVGADLGIVLDTDVDRSGVVDKNGEAINRNRLIAFLATVVLRDSPGTTIVTDSTTSNGLKVWVNTAVGVYSSRRGRQPQLVYCTPFFLGQVVCLSLSRQLSKSISALWAPAFRHSGQYRWCCNSKILPPCLVM